MKGIPLLLLLSSLASISATVLQQTGTATEGGSNLILSALCFENGRLREACLHDVSTQRLLEELYSRLTDVSANRIPEIAIEKDTGTDTVISEKRGREKNSGFYSNW
ncbi:hypothetical protein ScPMuIL_002935 [Solemya velum]